MNTSAPESHDQAVIGTMSRRELLLGAALVAAVSAFAATGGTLTGALGSELENCAAQLRSQPGMAAIGRHYLTLHPQHRDHNALRTVLRQDITAHRQSLAALIKSDFCADRTLLVDGWPLALTEARFCALAYLSTTA